MSDSVIVFDHVWKKFLRGEGHNTLKDLFSAMARRFLAHGSIADLTIEEFWAVQDVSFEVKGGEALGIIGPNGAGKSTTLKLLTKILRPTRGRFTVEGRVGALIEVAAGFHGDLTGRENVFLQGAIMGMRRADISRKLDDIIDFSGLHEFIDTPVKRYSSGMNARLGFSIAANLDPDALIIDEVLAVGDRAFQKRCIERMQVYKRRGVAIVFVSHNLQAVAGLCDKALLLNAGALAASGPPEEVIKAYQASAASGAITNTDDPIDMLSAVLLDEQDRPIGDRPVTSGESLTLRVAYLPKLNAEEVIFDLLLYRSSDDLLLYEGHFLSTAMALKSVVEHQPFAVDFAFRSNLTGGVYRVATRVRDTTMFSKRFLADSRRPALFTVRQSGRDGGIAHLQMTPVATAAEHIA